MPFKILPNFEIAMYVAQATGSCIVTDSVFRWRELVATAECDTRSVSSLIQLRASMEQAEFSFPYDVQEIGTLSEQGVFRGYPDVMRKIFKYLSILSVKGTKPNVEASINAEFKRVHASTILAAKKSGAHQLRARVSCLCPASGIQDNTVNRLLLMSSSEHHLPSVPMALFVKSNALER
jgi:hypothetical protein